jgi:hypothetical protein
MVIYTQAIASAKPRSSLPIISVAMVAPPGRGQFKGVRVAVRVPADDGVDNLCQHGHAKPQFSVLGHLHGSSDTPVLRRLLGC